ncbi:DinB family protein [Aquirufa sp. 2-AUSEE-184A6]|uniref:DinB family protein n=1 Tax=Aquirufa novilacunae TaxID=3139305 RepID=A0ABW8SWU4_9BACT
MHIPASYEYPNAPYFAEYLSFGEDENLFDVLKNQYDELIEIFEKAENGFADKAYAAGKWSLKGLLGHIVDSERIFSYRVLALSRGEKTALPGFDENEYQAASEYEMHATEDIIAQYKVTREATTLLLHSLSTKQWNQMGQANGKSISARALAWMIAGHEKHHLRIIKERYLCQNS